MQVEILTMVNLKCFILCLAITFVDSVPLINKNTTKSVNTLIKSIKEKSCVASDYPNIRKYQKIEQPKTQNLENRNFRLPNNTIPLHYDIHLSSEIHRGDTAFFGNVKINIRVTEESNTITLQSRRMLIQSIILVNLDGTNFDTSLFFTFNSELEFLTITIDRQLEVDQELILDITYVGVLGSFMDRGFFRSSFVDPETNVTNWLATTHFQPIDARQAFPCYDEVRYRTTIQLRIYHHSSYRAISNMPVSSIIENGDYITTIFEETPVLPTFLLSFTVSNFDFVMSNNEGLEMRVYARPLAIRNGEADDGLRIGEIMLRATEQIFDLPYSLPKSDQIAMPEFASAGANNWGLLSYFEPGLLKTNDDPFAQHVREILIAHEYSHIFFANLVSPISWAYLW